MKKRPVRHALLVLRAYLWFRSWEYAFVRGRRRRLSRREALLRARWDPGAGP